MATVEAKTLRLAQSTTAVSETKPLAIGMSVVSSAHTWLARLMFNPRNRCGWSRSSRCAQPSHLGERPFSTIMLQRERANLGMQGLQINRRLRRRGSTAKEVGRSLAALPFPLRNLVGMHGQRLGQFGSASSHHPSRPTPLGL